MSHGLAHADAICSRNDIRKRPAVRVAVGEEMGGDVCTSTSGSKDLLFNTIVPMFLSCELDSSRHVMHFIVTFSHF